MAEEDKARWTRLVADWESGDLTQREYAQERGITIHALRYWIYRLRRQSRPLLTDTSKPSEASQSPASQKQGLRLVPVHAVACAPQAARRGEVETGQLELIFPSGTCLRFPPGTDPTYLKAVTAVLAP